jgi:hypothetical protein
MGGTLAGFGLAPPKTPEANPGALQAAAMMAKVGKMAGDEETQKAAAEVAAMLQRTARGDADEDPDAKGAASAARTLAAMLTGEAAEAPAEEGDADEEEELPPGALRPPREPIDETLLAEFSDELRKYPEVEWACDVSDGSDIPVVAVRVDPSFTQREAEIEKAVRACAAARATAVTVLMLGDPQVMRTARAEGEVFFPWRKKK